MNEIYPEHPRAESLKTRKKLSEGFERGLVTPEGLSAHGRGEAFDYIIGEETTKWAKKAIKAAAAELILAENPVFSVNGNVSALVPEDMVKLESKLEIKIEVNLFHESLERKKKIGEHLKEKGVDEVLGTEKEHSTEVRKIKSNRRFVDERGIKKADVIMVPLEDGDRTEALVQEGKKVITIDLNPMSRTAKAANISIIDNIVRAMPALIEEIGNLQKKSVTEIEKIVEDFENERNLKKMLEQMTYRLEKLSKEEDS